MKKATAVSRFALFAAAVLAAPSLVHAQVLTPAGLWKTIDDDTKKEKSLVRIDESNGVYSGKVEKLLDPNAPKDPTCKACSDDRKDKPIVGMTVIRNVKQNVDDKGLFDGGDILDPNNGKVYRVRMRPMDNGTRLDVRGYIGVPAIGRTQTWQRVE